MQSPVLALKPLASDKKLDTLLQDLTVCHEDDGKLIQPLFGKTAGHTRRAASAVERTGDEGQSHLLC